MPRKDCRTVAMLRRILGPKKEWKRLHDEELHDCIYRQILRIQIKYIDIGRACSMYGGEEGCVQDVGEET